MGTKTAFTACANIIAETGRRPIEAKITPVASTEHHTTRKRLSDSYLPPLKHSGQCDRRTKRSGCR